LTATETPVFDLPVLKGCFPFRLGTTSYILPDEIRPNVELLGRHLDEVELVLFESGHRDNLPTEAEIVELGHLAVELDLTYNVHLPSDLWFADPDPAVRTRAVDTTLRFYRRTQSLNPTAYVLHLDRRSAAGVLADHETWRQRCQPCVEALLAGGCAARLLAVENLDTLLDWLAPVVDGLGLRYCLDAGHLLLYGHDTAGQIARHLDRIAMFHLHGVDGDTDHVGLDELPEETWQLLEDGLAGYRGGVSLEVFSLAHLRNCLPRISRLATPPIQGDPDGS
jgi:sugar phosphate isomerase/epimerase